MFSKNVFTSLDIFYKQKCHGYTFLMIFNLLNLLVKKLEMTDNLEEQELILTEREEELRKKEDFESSQPSQWQWETDGVVCQ